MKSSRKLLKGIFIIKFAVIFPLIIFAGCVTKEAVKNLTEEDVLKERVMAYWGYKVDKELDKAYDYEYNPEKMTKAVYIGRYLNPTLELRRFDLKTIKINKEEGSAEVALTIINKVSVPGVKVFETPTAITERWVRVGEVWYHVKPKY